MKADIPKRKYDLASIHFIYLAPGKGNVLKPACSEHYLASSKTGLQSAFVKLTKEKKAS